MAAGIWFIIAFFCGIIWIWITISQKIKGDRHQRRAREFVRAGDWQEAVLSYKLAIITRLDSAGKLQELVQELSDIYKSRGFDVNLGQLSECPQILRDLGLTTKNQKKKVELIMKLYTQTEAFLNSLPGKRFQMRKIENKRYPSRKPMSLCLQ